MADVRKYTDLQLYGRLLGEARPFWPFIAALLVVELLATPLALMTPVPLKIVVDSVLGNEPLSEWVRAIVPSYFAAEPPRLLFYAVILLVSIALLSHLRGLGVWLIVAYTGNRLVVRFRAKLFSHLQQLSFAYHDSKGSMDSMYRLQYDTMSIQTVATQGIIPFITSIVTLLAMVWVTAQIDAQLALVALCIVPPLFVLTKASREIIRKQWSALKAKESSAISVLHETLGALRVVKAFGKEESAREQFEAQSDEVVRGELRIALTEGGFDLVIALTLALGSAAVLFIGARHVQAGTITLGELLLVIGYLTQLYSPLQTMTKLVARLQGAIAGGERVFTVLDERPQVTEREDARRLDRARGEFEFRNVAFGYETGRPVLQSTSLRIPAGSRVGIYGPTGAGKSSLIGLLLRFHDPTRGAILLDGVDLRDYSLADLRRQYGIVLQDSVLFSASIAENIAYARPDATREDVVAAARAANADDFIRMLPDGYDTLVGERGMRLSGGERQRISLARAFLRDAPILLLDEPTSALDVATENQVIEALDRLMRDRTTFMIAHRLSTLESCDMWLRLQNGEPAQLRFTPPTPSDAGLVLPQVG